MPINAGPEFLEAQRKHEEARSLSEKMSTLREMMRLMPKHKGTEKLHKEFTRRMAKLQEQQKLEIKRRKGKKSIAVKKEGFQIVIIGFPNSGKSTLLKKLTNAEPKIAAYPFTTKKPEIGMLDFEGGKVQMVEVPALLENASEEQAELMSIILNCNGILLVYENEKQKQVLMNELYKFGVEKPVMFIDKGDVPDKKNFFNFFDLIRVYTKEPGEEHMKEKPLVVKRGTTVIEIARRVHKDFVKKFNYARVWGSTKYDGQRVEQDYKLKDKDIVEFHIK